MFICFEDADFKKNGIGNGKKNMWSLYRYLCIFNTVALKKEKENSTEMPVGT